MEDFISKKETESIFLLVVPRLSKKAGYHDWKKLLVPFRVKMRVSRSANAMMPGGGKPLELIIVVRGKFSPGMVVQFQKNAVQG